MHTGTCLHTRSTKGEDLSAPADQMLFPVFLVGTVSQHISATQGSVKLHCQRSPLLYADRQPDLKSDVTGFNEILLEKTL